MAVTSLARISTLVALFIAMTSFEAHGSSSAGRRCKSTKYQHGVHDGKRLLGEGHREGFSCS